MLIADIQHVKTTDGLCGMTPEEEYQDYLQRYLSSAEHVQKLCDRYPELVRVTEQVMEQAEAFLQEFLQRFENDHRKIAEEICPGVEHVGIRSLGLKAGDPHNGGRSTIRVQLENGAWLYYKPHSIREKGTLSDTLQSDQQVTGAVLPACTISGLRCVWMGGGDSQPGM